MKRLECSGCGAGLNNDEIAFCLHLHGGAAARFLCTECLAKEYACPPALLRRKMALLKQSGCRYFAETYV